MKQNKAVWGSLMAVIVLMGLGYWLYTSSQYASALEGVVGSLSGTTTTQDGVSGNTKQTDKPVILPFGDSAGPIVDARSMTVAQVVASLETSEFTSLFNSVGGSAMVSGSGQFTVFVPTNGAFNRLPAGTVSKLSAAEKVRLIEYHVVKGRALDTDALMAGTIETASGDMLNLNLGVNSVSLVGSAIVITQYNCKNGVVYTINNVLLPPQK